MQGLLEDMFVPQVMANPGVEKWAHYARFERKFLGQDRVKNLNCTFELARSIPYYRLPLRSLSLASLVDHIFGVSLDKTFQKADWGIRPLTSKQLEYAALDTEWCHGIYEHLRSIPQPPDAPEDDPDAIAGRYAALLGPLKDAHTIRRAIRDAAKNFMITKSLVRLSKFVLQTRTTHSTDLATLIEFATKVDPGEFLDLTVDLSKKLLSLLGPNAQAELESVAEIGVVQTFRGPRAPRQRGAEPTTYILNARKIDGLTRDYENSEHNVQVLESERSELRARMKRWMGGQNLLEWGDFRFSSPREQWKVDLRSLGDVLLANSAVQIGFPQRLWLAFEEPDLDALIAAGQSKQIPVLRWVSHAVSVGLEAQQSRDWDEAGTIEADE